MASYCALGKIQAWNGSRTCLIPYQTKEYVFYSITVLNASEKGVMEESTDTIEIFFNVDSSIPLITGV